MLIRVLSEMGWMTLSMAELCPKLAEVNATP